MVVQTSMVGSDATPKNMIHLQCIHGDVKSYLSQQLQLMVGAHTVVTTVTVAEKLAYAVIIG